MAYPITFLKYEVQTAGLNSAFLPAEAIFFFLRGEWFGDRAVLFISRPKSCLGFSGSRRIAKGLATSSLQVQECNHRDNSAGHFMCGGPVSIVSTVLLKRLKREMVWRAPGSFGFGTGAMSTSFQLGLGGYASHPEPFSEMQKCKLILGWKWMDRGFQHILGLSKNCSYLPP